MDRAKESIFNSLFSMGLVEDATILDLYAGSGSFGLECLSRGAKSVTFVESSLEVRRVLDENIETLGYGSQTKVVPLAVEKFLAAAPSVDLVFADPPYADDPWPTLLASIDAAVLVGHAEFEVQLSQNWELLKRKQYGRSHIFFATKALN